MRHATSNSSQGIFLTYPYLKEYRMGNVFSKHPNVWDFRGRVDDLITSPAYDTFLPKPMESTMECNPEIEVAVACQIKCIFV